MCGRFAVTTTQDDILEAFDVDAATAPLDPGARRDVRPTQEIGVVRAAGEGRSFDFMRWGFLPHWYKAPSDGPLLINARSETLAEKPAFREACRQRRCLIPADGFYEWQSLPDAKKKRVHWLAPHAGGLVAFAGIWQEGNGPDGRVNSVAIVTTAASNDLTHLHHRLPLVIGHNDWPLWLGEAGKGAARLMQVPMEGFWDVTPDRGPVETLL